MSKRSLLPQSPHHVLIYDEDWEFLTQAYGKNGAKPIGVSPAIRQMVHAFCKRLRANIEVAQEGLTVPTAAEVEEGVARQ